MGVMKFKIAKFPVQFSGNYNRVWRQAVLFPLKKCRACWIKVLISNQGECNAVSRATWTFFNFVFVFKGCVATANSSTVALTSSLGLLIAGSRSAP